MQKYKRPRPIYLHVMPGKSWVILFLIMFGVYRCNAYQDDQEEADRAFRVAIRESQMAELYGQKSQEFVEMMDLNNTSFFSYWDARAKRLRDSPYSGYFMTTYEEERAFQEFFKNDQHHVISFIDRDIEDYLRNENGSYRIIFDQLGQRTVVDCSQDVFPMIRDLRRFDSFDLRLHVYGKVRTEVEIAPPTSRNSRAGYSMVMHLSCDGIVIADTGRFIELLQAEQRAHMDSIDVPTIGISEFLDSMGPNEVSP